MTEGNYQVALEYQVGWHLVT